MGTYIIAEAGVNHNGSLELAKRLVDQAKKSGANCIKFQTFKSELLVTEGARLADYQTNNSMDSSSQLEMLRKLELSYLSFEELYNYCLSINIDFISTPFDLASAEFLNSLGMKTWKISSGEITNLTLLKYIGSRNGRILLSTGMCDIDEVNEAVDILKSSGDNEIILLHCTTEYPAPYESVNLNAMLTLRDKFGLDVGYSDHTEGIEISIAAVAMGAKVIEKHFTLNKNMVGPDHRASIEPDELSKLVNSIRHVDVALGDGKKVIQEVEKKNRLLVRKSIVANRHIKKGEIITEKMLCLKRPGEGLSPMRINDVIGTKAIKDFSPNEFIQIKGEGIEI